MDMGPHMKMTVLRSLQPGDQEKADAIVQAARAAAEKYMDYKVALADGYKIFCPTFRKSSITSRIIKMHSKLAISSTHRSQPPCFMKRTAMVTS